MKKLLLVFFLIMYTHASFGQSISAADSIQVMATLQEVFESFESRDYDKFRRISTAEIWCLICESGKPPQPGSQKIKRKAFFHKNRKRIATSTAWQKASTLGEVKLQKENNTANDITAFITIWKENEYAAGHEGAALGIHFQKVNGEYKFSGIEAVP